MLLVIGHVCSHFLLKIDVFNAILLCYFITATAIIIVIKLTDVAYFLDTLALATKALRLSSGQEKNPIVTKPAGLYYGLIGF